MKLIAHRGNINGPNLSEENKPKYIEEAISRGYDVEIDVWYNPLVSQFYLGHDAPTYAIDMEWLNRHEQCLWIHCKNIESLYEFLDIGEKFNYFWHQNDDYTLTSKNRIWTYPGKEYTSKSVLVMPEWEKSADEFVELMSYNCYAICSDYVGYLNV